MKSGNLLTAAGIMFALATAASKLEVSAISAAMSAGRFRHRGKGRGAITHNNLGKTRRCRHEHGTRAAARNLRMMQRALGNPFQQLARHPGWSPR